MENQTQGSSMSDWSSLVSAARSVLTEDAGVSSDGTPGNQVGAGKIDGIGVGAKGEPGVDKRKKRKLRALRLLHSGAILTREDWQEVKSELGNLTEDEWDALFRDAKAEHERHKKKVKKGTHILLNPELRDSRFYGS
jgi:hypothetical protein